MAAGAELDRGVGVQQDVGGPQELVARVDPEGDVVQAAGDAGLVEDQPEVVGLLVVRHHREHRDVGVVGRTVYSVNVEPSVSRYHSASPTGSALMTVTWSIIRG